MGMTSPIMLSVQDEAGPVIFYNRYPADIIDWVGAEQVRNAWSTALNIKSGLEENKEILTSNVLHAIRAALFERFAELGVPCDLISPTLMAFREVEEALRARGPQPNSIEV